MAIPPLLIGLTVAGFGASTPERLVSVEAAWRGVPDIAVGNIIGSNIANILLTVGITSLVWPIRVSGATLRRDTAVMVAAALVLVPIFAAAEIGRLPSALLVLVPAGYLTWAYLKPGLAIDEDDAPATTSIIAAFRRQSEIAIGNIVGSNIFNVLGILGVTALIKPIPAAECFLNFDLTIMIVASLGLTALLLTRPVIGRVVGMVVVAAYVAYVWSAQ